MNYLSILGQSRDQNADAEIAHHAADGRPLDFTEEVVPVDDLANRAELLLLAPSILVPCLTHKGIKI